MSKERVHPTDPFGFTEHEQLYTRISDIRFRALLEAEATTIHNIHLDSNTYGEFIFVTLGCSANRQRSFVTFFGLGYHESRERWITDHWYWYTATLFSDTLQQHLALPEAQALLEQRQAEIEPHITDQTQTPYGALFELLADLTDEDGALSELEDLGAAAHWLLNNEEPQKPHQDRENLPRTKPLFDDEGEL